MASSAPNLPGFYFDSEKNRYFKIQPGEEHNPNHQQKRVNVDVQHDAKKLKARTVENICPVLYQRQRTCQRHTFKTDVLLNRLLVLKEKKKLLKSHKWTSIRWAPIYEIVPSADFSTCLCHANTKLMHLPTDQMFQKPNDVAQVYILDSETILDFAYTSAKVKPLQCICNCILAYNNSVIRLQPLLDGSQKVDKFTSDVPFACAGNQAATSDAYNVSYSSGRKTLLIKSTERHFSSSRAGKDFADVFTFFSTVRSQCFSPSSNLHFSGLSNGTAIGVDWRCKHHMESDISLGRRQIGAVMALHVFNDSRQVILRNIAERDAISLWDVRKASKPVCNFISLEVPRGSKRGNRKIHICRDQILSCVMSDGNGRMWNILDGKLIYKLDQTNTNPAATLKNLMYMDHYVMRDGAPAFFGFTETSLGWYSLSSNLLSSMKNSTE